MAPHKSLHRGEEGSHRERKREIEKLDKSISSADGRTFKQSSERAKRSALARITIKETQRKI